MENHAHPPADPLAPTPLKAWVAVGTLLTLMMGLLFAGIYWIVSWLQAAHPENRTTITLSLSGGTLLVGCLVLLGIHYRIRRQYRAIDQMADPDDLGEMKDDLPIDQE